MIVTRVPLQGVSTYRGRRQFVLVLLGLCALGLLLRAVYLQLIHKDFLQAAASDRHERIITLKSQRGMIVDRQGEPLAVSSPVSTVSADLTLV